MVVKENTELCEVIKCKKNNQATRPLSVGFRNTTTYSWGSTTRSILFSDSVMTAP